MEILGFVLAAFVGISLGLIGGGGSILTMPILVYIMRVNPVLATSYSLFIVGSTSMVGAYNNYRKGLVSIRTALLFGLSSITTVFLTRKILLPKIPAILYSTRNIRITQSMMIMVLFAVLMLLASIKMIANRNAVDPSTETDSDNSLQLHRLILYGVAIGLATGLLGAGGGFLLIPALVILIKMPMKEAIGTSLLIIALNSLVGFTGDIGHFKIDWTFLVLITSIATAGVFIGGFLARKIDGGKLKKTFGWFVMVMSIYILIKEILIK